MTRQAGPLRNARRARGFTLVELMISVALVLILMLAISWIFGQTTATISTGIAAADVGREHRGSWRTLRNDFEVMIPGDQQPGIIIHSDAVPAFRDRTMREADLDHATVPANLKGEAISTRDMDGDNVEGEASVAGENSTGWQTNERIHRVDRLSFYTRSGTPYVRKTAPDGSLIDPSVTSSEAWIWYGLLALPTDADGDGVLEYTFPGSSDRTPPTTPNVFEDPDRYQAGYYSNWILGRVVTLLVDPTTTPTPTGVIEAGAYPAPLAGNSPADTARPAQYGPAGPWVIQQSRFDVALTTAELMRRGNGTAAGTWFAPFNYAFHAKSFVQPAPTGPVRSAEAARTVPVFMPGAAQFIVEFAGDFYQQAATETFKSNVIDYDDVGGGIRRIRWYGRPRDVDGDGFATGVDDVKPIVPGRWNLSHSGTNTPWPSVLPPIGPPTNMANIAVEHPFDSGFGPGTGYVAAFRSPDVPSAAFPNDRKPSMIRLTITLVDRQGRLQEGQTIEHILRVP